MNAYQTEEHLDWQGWNLIPLYLILFLGIENSTLYIIQLNYYVGWDREYFMSRC